MGPHASHLHRLRLIVSVVAAVSVAAAAILGQQQPERPRAQQQPERPRLIVIIAVDQMRADYVDWYGHQWTGGLRQLIDRGAVFRQAAYPYLNTVTCTGHATISTGTFPARHGVILNQWWDRASGGLITCTHDPAASLLSYGEPAKGGDSAVRLLAPSFAAELRLRFGRSSRAAVFSLKDRSAIMLAGHQADVVTWLNEPSHQWVTSKAYSDRPLPAIQRYVRQHPIAVELNNTWTRLAPADRYLYQDDGIGERPPPGWTRTFPHPLSGEGQLSKSVPYLLWETSPFSDEYLASLTIASVDALKLGQGTAPDFLAIGFSALDLVGHRFGPRSHEVQDVLARLDATLARLFGHLDQRVGAGRYVVALSADHGVSSIPEQLRAEGLDAGRIVLDEIAERVERVLTAYFGGGKYVARAVFTDLYFQPGVAAKIEADAVARRAVIDAIQTVPGVARAFMASELSGGRTDDLQRAAALSFFSGRSGDVIVVPRANWFFALRETPSSPFPAATHGTANPYDTRVPLIFMGHRIKPGEYGGAVTPADIAPTLAAIAGVTMGRSDGRALVEAID